MHSKRELTKKHIIEQAAPVFNKKGYGATSMADLIAATGLTKGSIYGNFRDKEEVAEHALRYNIDRLRVHFKNELQKHSDPVDKLLAYCTVYKRIYPEVIENGGCPMLNAAIDADYNNPTLKAVAQDAIQRWQKSFELILDEGKKIGRVKSSVNSKHYSALVLSMIEGSLLLAKLQGDFSLMLNNIRYIEHIIRTELEA